jgi:hypothetical protein
MDYPGYDFESAFIEVNLDAYFAGEYISPFAKIDHPLDRAPGSVRTLLI